jgi:hypothetical protein
MDMQISKALMGVFMKATQVESAVTDLILAANAKCNSANSEEKQLTDLFDFLGVTYDAGKAKEMGGTQCFSGPEGVQHFTFRLMFQIEFQRLGRISSSSSQTCQTVCIQAYTFQTRLFFSGHRKLSVIGLMATEIFRTRVANRCDGSGGATAGPLAGTAALASESESEKGKSTPVVRKAFPLTSLEAFTFYWSVVFCAHGPAELRVHVCCMLPCLALLPSGQQETQRCHVMPV